MHIYIYISKSWSITFIVATLLLRHISSHVTHLLPTLSLSLSQLFFFLLIFLTYCYTFSNIFPSLLPFHFPTTNYLISLFFYPFNFLYFWLFLFSSSYYKFPILSHIRCIVFSHIKCCFSQFFFSIFWWSLSPIIGCAREIMVHSQSIVIMVQCIRSFFYLFIFYFYH